MLVVAAAANVGSAGAVPAAAEGRRSATDSEGYVRKLEDALAPAAAAVFDDLQRDLRARGRPFPERVRARLRTFFAGDRLDGVALRGAVVEDARFIVDPERTRALFAAAPGVAAITFGDVIAFAPGEYRPDCVEGLALIAHELVHVAQYRALGRDRFLERYFVTEILEGVLGGEVDPARGGLEVAAYCHQARVCSALNRSRIVPPCAGTSAVCRSCAASDGQPPR